MLSMAKNSYCYQERAIKAPDKYTELRTKVKNIFLENYSAYGYRRIHKEIKKSEKIISEKVIRKLMREEHLVVFIVKKKKYNSYQGEITPAVENIVNRNFNSEKPNDKWLTNITELNGCTLDNETIVHSDKGCHYTSIAFIEKLKEADFVQSMSRKGNCWDNAPQESFYGHMKDEIKDSVRRCETFD